MSPLGRTICSNIDFYKCSTEIQVENGLLTQFWEEPWVENMPLKDRFPRLYDITCSSQQTVGRLHQGAQWDLTFYEAADFFELISTLHSVNIKQDISDKRIWRWEEETFSVKSATKLLSRGGARVNRRNTVWNKNVPIKIGIFLWK